MKVKNKLTKETLDIPYSAFKTQFAKEIQTALESYTKTENNKSYFKINQKPKANFYFNLQWNFNHFGNSNWYIEKI